MQGLDRNPANPNQGIACFTQPPTHSLDPSQKKGKKKKAARPTWENTHATPVAKRGYPDGPIGSSAAKERKMKGASGEF
jgi:hypothetical protein